MNQASMRSGIVVKIFAGMMLAAGSARAASGTWPFFQRLHRKAHLEGQSIKSGKVSK